MQRVFNVDKWTTLNEKESLAFANPKPRNVRLDVNSPSDVEIWYVCTLTGETHFIALTRGRDVIEFGCTGPFEITIRGGFLNIFTNDGDDISVKATAEQSFVKVMERQRRNPELEHMMYMMNLNMQRNMEKQAYEIERLVQSRVAAASAAVGTGASGDAGQGTSPAGSGGTAPEGTAPDAGGTNAASTE